MQVVVRLKSDTCFTVWSFHVLCRTDLLTITHDPEVKQMVAEKQREILSCLAKNGDILVRYYTTGRQTQSRVYIKCVRYCLHKISTINNDGTTFLPYVTLKRGYPRGFIFKRELNNYLKKKRGSFKVNIKLTIILFECSQNFLNWRKDCTWKGETRRRDYMT